MGRRSDHEATLAALREKALPYDEPARASDRESHPRAAELARLLESRTNAEEEVAVRRTWMYADADLQWQHDLLAELVAGLAALDEREKGLVADVERRLEFARTVRKRSIDDAKAMWDEVIASIRKEKISITSPGCPSIPCETSLFRGVF